MRSSRRVAASPPRPVLVYDGNCGFCRASVRCLRAKTGETLDYLPAQDAGIQKRFPQISRRNLDTAVHLFETDGWAYSGAEAIARALAHGQPGHWSLFAYQHFPIVARASEWVYRLVARRRSLLSRLVRQGLTSEAGRGSCLADARMAS